MDLLKENTWHFVQWLGKDIKEIGSGSNKRF